jgi:galactose mutarotase-like enzyme
MYLALIGRFFSRTATRLVSGAWLRSSITWIVLILLALVGTGVAIHEKGKGRLHQLKTDLGETSAPASTPLPQPGGQDPIILKRDQQTGSMIPEFLSATMLPGRGMNILQITAYLPGKGEVSLLQAPSLAEAAKAMTGTESDANGEESLALGSAIEVPWAGRIAGASLPGGASILANWQGRGLALPANSPMATLRSSIGGLLLRRAASSSSTPETLDGGLAEATFSPGSFNGHWPSQTEVKTSFELRPQLVEITVTARNIGNEPEPVGIGWRPKFAIPAGTRAETLLRIPSTIRTEMSGQTGLPTGKLLPVAGTPYDFSAPGGAPLKSLALNDTFVHLKSDALNADPEVELRYPGAGYGIRLTALTPTIKAIHVDAPAGESMISITPQSNYDDPFGREWNPKEDTGLTVLQPGQSMEWKVRLQLFLLSGHSRQVLNQ